MTAPIFPIVPPVSPPRGNAGPAAAPQRDATAPLIIPTFRFVPGPPPEAYDAARLAGDYARAVKPMPLTDEKGAVVPPLVSASSDKDSLIRPP